MRVRFVDGDAAAVVDQRSRIERRVRLVVGRRAPRVAWVEIQVSPLPAPAEGASLNGGRPHRCRIRARLVDGETVVVDERADDLASAVEVAIWRLDRRLDRPSARASA